MSEGMDSTEMIARHIAAKNWTEDKWAAYHPIVRQTVEWLEDHGYLAIVTTAEKGSPDA